MDASVTSNQTGPLPLFQYKTLTEQGFLFRSDRLPISITPDMIHLMI